MPKLFIRLDNGEERIHELVDEETTIGRGSINTIQIHDSKASRQHCKVLKEGEAYRLIDLDSRNGTKVNGLKTSDHLLQRGETITIGKTHFGFDAPPVLPQPSSKQIAAAARKPAPPEPKGPHYILEAISGENAGKTYELGAGEVKLGRRSDNTIPIEDEAASSYHAEIKRSPLGYVLEDLASTNGTRVRAPGESEFQKIVKTPLAVGMEIRVGRTVLVFKNIGEPAEGDHIFSGGGVEGAVLGRQAPGVPVTAPRGPVAPQMGMSRGILYLGSIAVFMGVLALAVMLFTFLRQDDKNNGKKPPPPPLPAEQVLFQEDFSGAPTDDGLPQGWKFDKHGVAQMRVSMVRDQDRGEPNQCAQMSKEGAKPVNAASELVSETAWTVKGGQAYEIRARLKTAGQVGVFGAAIQWEGAGREDKRVGLDPILLAGDHPSWEPKKQVFVAPSWASRARVVLFNIGDKGQVYFDDVQVTTKPEARPRQWPSRIGKGAVNIMPLDPRGKFTVRVGHYADVLSGGELVFYQQPGRTLSSFRVARPDDSSPAVSPDGAEVTFTGEIYDFESLDFARYKLLASRGTLGALLRVEGKPLAEGAKPALRFSVGRPFSPQSAQLCLADGKQLPAPPGEEVAQSALKELLFWARSGERLVITVKSDPHLAHVRLGPLKGDDARLVEITYRQDFLEVEFAESSGEELKRVETLLDAFRQAQKQQDYGAMDEVARKIHPFASGYPGAAAEITQTMKEVEAEAEKDGQWAERVVAESQTAEQITTGVAQLNERAKKWGTHQIAETLRQAAARLEAKMSTVRRKDTEQQAARVLEDALVFARQEAHELALELVRENLLAKPEFKDTPAYKEAQELLPAWEKQLKLHNLRREFKNTLDAEEAAGRYGKAVKEIEADPEYKKYKDELPDIVKRVESFKMEARKREQKFE